MDVTFGGFTFSFDTLKLSKEGRDVRLVGQPLRLLVLLLEEPGKVVTHDAIRQRLWQDTHVDFDHSLHVALSRLRVALGDRGRNPTFIETIPGIGYRFLARVETVPAAQTAPSRPARPFLRRAAWLALTAIVAALLALAVVRQHYDQFVPHPGQTAR